MISIRLCSCRSTDGTLQPLSRGPQETCLLGLFGLDRFRLEELAMVSPTSHYVLIIAAYTMICPKATQNPMTYAVNPTYRLHCSSFVGLPFKILNIRVVKPQKGATTETIGKPTNPKSSGDRSSGAGTLKLAETRPLASGLGRIGFA